MLSEIRDLGQQRTDRRRRWFCDDDYDLVVWRNKDGKIAGFQLCYDKRRNERAMTWRRKSGFTHHIVDTGEELSTKNMTPILIPDGRFPSKRILQHLGKNMGSMDSRLAKFVLKKLQEFSARRKGRSTS